MRVCIQFCIYIVHITRVQKKRNQKRKAKKSFNRSTTTTTTEWNRKYSAPSKEGDRASEKKTSTVKNEIKFGFCAKVNRIQVSVWAIVSHSKQLTPRDRTKASIKNSICESKSSYKTVFVECQRKWADSTQSELKSKRNNFQSSFIFC